MKNILKNSLLVVGMAFVLVLAIGCTTQFFEEEEPQKDPESTVTTPVAVTGIPTYHYSYLSYNVEPGNGKASSQRVRVSPGTTQATGAQIKQSLGAPRLVGFNFAGWVLKTTGADIDDTATYTPGITLEAKFVPATGTKAYYIVDAANGKYGIIYVGFSSVRNFAEILQKASQTAYIYPAWSETVKPQKTGAASTGWKNETTSSNVADYTVTQASGTRFTAQY